MLDTLVLGLALLAVPQEPAAWYQLYDQGVMAIEQGRPAEARPLLEAALAKRPTEGLKVRTYGVFFVDYMPHLYLAIAAQMLGELESARASIATAEASGIAARSEAGAPLLAAYRILLRSPGEDATQHQAATPVERRGFRIFPSQPPKLSDTEYQQLRKQVAARCGVPDDVTSSRAPWYFHYELALVLARQGDPQRSVEALIVSTDHKPQPQRQARMYGMWFTDYIPFYWLAREHALLGNWECVTDALEASQKSGEVSERDQEFAEFRALVEEARRHARP
jgi:tetratricopeptide (TPR) repeat protein